MRKLIAFFVSALLFLFTSLTASVGAARSVGGYAYVPSGGHARNYKNCM